MEVRTASGMCCCACDCCIRRALTLLRGKCTRVSLEVSLSEFPALNQFRHGDSSRESTCRHTVNMIDACQRSCELTSAPLHCALSALIVTCTHVAHLRSSIQTHMTFRELLIAPNCVCVAGAPAPLVAFMHSEVLLCTTASIQLSVHLGACPFAENSFFHLAQ